MTQPAILSEALRYVGITNPDPETETRARRMMALAREKCPPRHVLRVFDLSWVDGVPTLASIPLPGNTARLMLDGCTRAALLVCTLGAAFEREVEALRHRDAADMLLFDACGSALVEQGCDDATCILQNTLPGVYLTDRFSPGYGDLPLTLQQPILAAADATRRLAVTANVSSLLIPQKTVTAIIGLADTPRPARVRGCAYCGLRGTCPYRVQGMTCQI